MSAVQPIHHSNALQFDVSASLAELAEVAEQWDALADVCPQRLPTLSHAWVTAHLQCCLQPHDRWLCAVARDGDRLVGVLPVLLLPHSRRGARGLELRGIFDSHTSSGDALAKSGREREILDGMLTALFAHERRATYVRLGGVREGSSTLTAIDAGLKNALALRRAATRGSYISTDGQLSDFYDHLSGNFKGNLRKARNKLSRLPELETVFTSSWASDVSSFDRFLQLEMSGWKGAAGTAIALSPVRTDYYRNLTQNLAAQGWLEWHELRTGDRTIASHLAARAAGSLALIKIAYDEEFSRYAPGNMLFERCLERAFEDDTLVEVNCLSDARWHRNWRMSQSDYYDVWLFPRRLSSLLYRRPSVALRQSMRHSVSRGLRAAFTRLPPSYQSRVRELVQKRARR